MSEGTQPTRGRSLRIFLSHAASDTILAQKLRKLLSRRVSGRIFITEEISAGEDWQSRLRNELAGADVVLALLTPQSVDSNWLLHEIGAAWALEKPIVAVVTRGDLLNQVPLAGREAVVVELKGLDTPKTADRSVHDFERVLATSHIAA